MVQKSFIDGSTLPPKTFELDSLKALDTVKFNIDSVSRIGDIDINVKTAIPEIYTGKIKAKLDNLPSSSSYDNAVMKLDVSARLLDGNSIQKVTQNSLDDALAVKGDVKNITKSDMDFYLEKNLEIEATTAKNSYKSDVKDIAAEIDPRLGTDGARATIDRLIETPDTVKTELEAKGQKSVTDPVEVEKLKKTSIGDKILAYGGRAAMLAGLLLLFIPGGSGVLSDILETITDPIVDVSTGLLNSVFGPIAEVLTSLIKPVLILSGIALGGFLLYKFISRPKKDPSSQQRPD